MTMTTTRNPLIEDDHAATAANVSAVLAFVSYAVDTKQRDRMTDEAEKGLQLVIETMQRALRF